MLGRSIRRKNRFIGGRGMGRNWTGIGQYRGVRPWLYNKPPKGYTYVGHCRCGMGPNAFFLDQEGNVAHAWNIYHWGTPQELTKEDLKAELEILKKEKVELEKDIETLEKRLEE